MTGKERILKAALRLFAENGYTETRTSEIAQAADISEPMIFKHFQSKQNLLRELILESQQMHDDMVRTAVSSAKDELGVIEGLVGGFIDLARMNRHHYLLMVRVCAFRLSDPELPCGRFHEDSTALYLDAMVKALEDGGASGALKPVAAQTTAMAFMAMAYGAARLCELGHDPKNEVRKALMETIRSAILPAA